MKERILKLCKRLNKFSQADIETISGLSTTEVIPILDELIIENKIIKNDDIYLYRKKEIKIKKKKRILNLESQSKEIIDLIIKCFCAGVPLRNTALVVNLSRNTINNYFAHFRKLLYEKQKQELEILYTLNPKLPSEFSLMNNKIFLYCYNDTIYISDKPFFIEKLENKHSKEEMKIIHNIYCKVRRIFNSHSYLTSFIQIAYEKVWFQNEDYNQKLSELYNSLNIS